MGVGFIVNGVSFILNAIIWIIKMIFKAVLYIGLYLYCFIAKKDVKEYKGTFFFADRVSSVDVDGMEKLIIDGKEIEAKSAYIKMLKDDKCPIRIIHKEDLNNKRIKENLTYYSLANLVDDEVEAIVDKELEEYRKQQKTNN